MLFEKFEKQNFENKPVIRTYGIIELCTYQSLELVLRTLILLFDRNLRPQVSVFYTNSIIIVIFNKL